MNDKHTEARISNEDLRVSDSMIDRVSGTVPVQHAATQSSAPLEPEQSQATPNVEAWDGYLPLPSGEFAVARPNAYPSGAPEQAASEKHSLPKPDAAVSPRPTDATENAANAVVRTEVSPAISRRSYRRMVELALAISVIGVGLLAVAHRPNLSRSQLTQLNPAEMVVSPSLQPIQLTVEIIPENAKLFLDGVPVSNPLQLAHSADDAVHEIRAEAPGCLPRTEHVHFNRNLLMVLALPQAAVSADE